MFSNKNFKITDSFIDNAADEYMHDTKNVFMFFDFQTFLIYKVNKTYTNLKSKFGSNKLYYL